MNWRMMINDVHTVVPSYPPKHTHTHTLNLHESRHDLRCSRLGNEEQDVFWNLHFLCAD